MNRVLREMKFHSSVINKKLNECIIKEYSRNLIFLRFLQNAFS